MGTRRPAVGALCAAVLNGNECTDARTMRVAHCRPATPKTPRQSPYFQELEPFSSKPHPGWMHLFKQKDAKGGISDPKVARRSQSTLARPQGVLDLMENSWYVVVAAAAWTMHNVNLVAFCVSVLLCDARYRMQQACGILAGLVQMRPLLIAQLQT